MIKSRIFKNRYQADKARKNDPYCTGDEVIVKVDGGYVLIDREAYKQFRKGE